MSASFKHRLAIWFWNGLTIFVSGVAAGGSSVLAAEGVNLFKPGTVMHFTPHQFITVCFMGGLVNVFTFWKTPAGKLPSIDTQDGTTPVPPLPPVPPQP